MDLEESENLHDVKSSSSSKPRVSWKKNSHSELNISKKQNSPINHELDLLGIENDRRFWIKEAQ